MSNNKDPQSYLMAAGGLAILAGGITYCATNWDEPPEWWPNRLQPWWNKKDPETVQTDQFVKQVDEAEEPNVEVTESVINNENASEEKSENKPEEKSEEKQEKTESEVASLKENLVKTENVKVELTENN